MFTQKISMDCTREQYEKYLKDELLKMEYKEVGISDWGDDNDYITNYFGSEGEVGNINEQDICTDNVTYLGAFNAPLFLALAAMTDSPTGSYREYFTNGVDFIAYPFVSIVTGYLRKATKEEIMAKFGENKTENGKEIAEKLCNDINEFDGDRIREYIDYFFSRSIDESDAINLLKSKGYKILKPKTWEEI